MVELTVRLALARWSGHGDGYVGGGDGEVGRVLKIPEEETHLPACPPS